MKKVISIMLMIVIAFRNISMTVCGEENTNLMAVTIPIISNSQIDKIDTYVSMSTLESETQIFITTNDFSNLTQMEEIIDNATNTVWNKGFNYFVLDKQEAIIKAYYIINTDTIIDIKKIVVSKEMGTFECQYINNTYYVDMQSTFQYLHVDYDCNFQIDSDKYIAINCIDTLDMLQREYISNLSLYRYSYIVDKEAVNKSKGIKILDENGLDIAGLVYDLEKERENISIDDYYKCLNIGLAEEGLEWLNYESNSIEYAILDKKLQNGAEFQQAIIDEIKSIDSNTLKSVGTLESIVNGIGHIITMTGIAIDTLEVEIEREQEKYIIETIFNDIKKAEYTQEYFSLLSNSILQKYQYYAIEDNMDINNRKEFSEYMKNHKYTYRNGVRYNDTDIIRNTAILLYSDFCSYLNGEEYAKHIDINAFIDHYFNIMETTISLGFNLDTTDVASQYAVANDCYNFFIENNKDEFTWWQSLTDYSDNIIISYNFYNLRNAFLNVNSTSNLLSKDSLIGSQKMEIMMLKALLKASESNPKFITNSQKQKIETSLKASSNLLFRLENCVVTNENNLVYKSIYDNSNNNKINLQNCSWLLDLNNNYTWHLSPTIEAEDIIVSDSEKVYNFSKNPFDEYSIVKQNGKFNFIKYDGTYISDKQYDKWYFSKPNAITCSSKNNDCITILGENGNKISYESHDSGWGSQGFYIDNKTKEIYSTEYGSASKYNESDNVVVQSADVTITSSKQNNSTFELNNVGKYGIANSNGLAVDCICDDACMNIGSNIISLEKNGKWGYFNEDGTQIIDFVCEPFESKILDVMWLHNHDGESIQHPFLSSSGYIPVKINGQCGYYDTQGNEVIPCGTFEEVRPVHNGLAWVKKDGKWGVIKLVEITEPATTPTESSITAVDLIDKTLPEIISLMNGEYQIIKTENDGYIYIQNQSVLSGMEFYVQVSGDNIISANNGEEIHSDTLKAKLESGELTLDGIQVNKSGKVSETIQADMDYKLCSKVLGDFNCIGGTGGYLGGDVSSLSYDYNNNNAKVILNFEIPEEIYKDLILGKISSVSAEKMKSYNPKLKNVVIRNVETNTNVQTEQKSNTNNFNINDYNGMFYPNDSNTNAYIIINSQSEKNVNIEVNISNPKATHVSQVIFSGNVDNNVLIFEEDDGFGRNSYTLEFLNQKVYLTAKCIESYGIWGIPELNKLELTKQSEIIETQIKDIPISDIEILWAVNKYLEENKGHLGTYFTVSDAPYCSTEHMYSNDKKWSCPINLSWESYSANEIAGAYPHFAYVDKSTLKCTLTANYETVVEFDLKAYIK